MVGDGSIVRIYPCYDDLIDVVYFNPIGHNSNLKGGGDEIAALAIISYEQIRIERDPDVPSDGFNCKSCLNCCTALQVWSLTRTGR